ncbi:hypothetical protein MalM25_17590 [Planctomycetes bacterium MalM25]|nr:hypothetical protein MalM25_17590 [Planctomycetes bacterium MalM25]
MPAESKSELPGIIAGCATAGCGYTCCEFAQGNYIVLPPGEVEEAKDRGERLDHLELSPLPFGGWRAICHAQKTSTCDGGYKPLDCRSYPYFPIVDSRQMLTAGLKGAKCPLKGPAIASHRHWVERAWQSLLQSSPELLEWLRSVRLVGYEPVSER